MANTPSTTVTMYGVKEGCLQPLEYARPKSPPRDCGSSNEDLECLGCGEKLGHIAPGHCYLVEGKVAFKK